MAVWITASAHLMGNRFVSALSKAFAPTSLTVTRVSLEELQDPEQRGLLFPSEPPEIIFCCDEGAWAAVRFGTVVRMDVTVDGFRHDLLFAAPWEANVAVYQAWRRPMDPELLGWFRLEAELRSRG